jgi:hypothetical protein
MAGSFARYWHGEPQRLSAIELHLLPKPRSPSQHNGLADKRQGLVALRDFVPAEDRFESQADMPSALCRVRSTLGMTEQQDC